jgi:hypothetical protein
MSTPAYAAVNWREWADLLDLSIDKADEVRVALMVRLDSAASFGEAADINTQITNVAEQIALLRKQLTLIHKWAEADDKAQVEKNDRE